ncbi:hypothetical protein GA0070616_1349 [Micromonospora nigra]|uniref:Uncharacterized protein n=1 Tax=Micromonospora nigra TaxID=145857 RepID=A0A1C6RL27_9ACTN|nr:hypothetical protein [Micromonospora nigra]SCL17746.1 hypothetical protein GA0070616_1349 [Micromonospora nigra]
MWSYLLSSIGILGLLIAARQPRIGWTINLAAQALWVVYALSTGQPGFLLAAVAYTVAYGRLLRRATKASPARCGPYVVAAARYGRHPCRPLPHR